MKKIMQSHFMSFLLHSTQLSHLLGKIVLLLVVPYAYLLLCGLVFDMLLKWYNMVMFIFCSFIGLYLVAFVIIGVAIAQYVKYCKKS